MIEWVTALPDWERRIVAGQSLVPCAPLFPDQARIALDIFKSLKIVDVPGQPTFGEASAQWVFDFVSVIFGAYDEETAKQFINEYFLMLAKKNTKSTTAAAIMITALLLNGRYSAEALILAPTKEVADNAYKPASDTIKHTPGLSQILEPKDNLKEIRHLETGAVLKVVAADTDTVSGNKSSFVLIDELWLFGKKSKAEAMLAEATGGLVSRPEGFVIYLSTQSDDPPAGIFKKKLDYFRDVRDGKITDKKSLGVLYEFPKHMIETEAYLNPKNFYIANPNIGRSVSAEWIEDKIKKETDISGRRIILAKHLNIEIGQGLRSDRWAGAEFWKRQSDDKITFDSLFEQSEVIVAGIDGGGLDDLFGLSLIGRDKKTKHWLSWSHAWAHEGVLERRKSIASLLRDFEKDGDLTIVNDSLSDISEIVEIIGETKSRELLAMVAVDPAGLGEMVEALATIGITPDAGNLVAAPQGYAMMNAIKTAERKAANGTLRHAPSHMMDWCVTNLKIEPTATAIRATKQTAGDAKIDPVMALFDAVTVMIRNPEAKAKRTYNVYWI